MFYVCLQLPSQYDTMSACFSIYECVIGHLITDTGQRLDAAVVGQLQGILTEAMAAIIHFINESQNEAVQVSSISERGC